MAQTQGRLVRRRTDPLEERLTVTTSNYEPAAITLSYRSNACGARTAGIGGPNPCGTIRGQGGGVCHHILRISARFLRNSFCAAKADAPVWAPSLGRLRHSPHFEPSGNSSAPGRQSGRRSLWQPRLHGVPTRHRAPPRYSTTASLSVCEVLPSARLHGTHSIASLASRCRAALATRCP